MNNETKAWAAGFFDGEGCVYIRKTNAKGYNNGVRYDLICAISQRKTEELYSLKGIYGGCVSNYKRKGTHRSWGRWSVVAKDAVMFLKDIKPFARIKYQEINLALKFQSEKGNPGRNLTETQKMRQEELYLELKQLKG